ncbi:MAG: biopolymer transporter ExbD [Planctomycetes bacterium]|nr:biopolymer transporter ExbD [Planctomycetota bacterium]
MFGKRRKKEEKPIETDLNRVVTPMLDMTFQILFFLIMNFRLPTPEGQIDLLLPSEDSGPAQVTAPLLDEPDKDEYRLRIFSGDSKTIAGMTWKPKKTEAEPIGPNLLNDGEVNRYKSDQAKESDSFLKDLEISLYGLAVKLREYQPKEGGKQPIIKIECHKKLLYSELLRVMDVVRKMNLTNVTVLPAP